MNIRKECSCGGNNENCYRCFGRGYYYADDFKPLTTSLSTARGKGVSYLVCPYCKDTVTKSHIKKCKFNTDKSVQEKQPVKDAETGRVNIECPYCGIHVSNLKRHMDIVHSSLETDQVVSEQITTAISINQPTKNMANRNLVKCPHCNSNVRNDRLQKHINKSHKPQKINRATPDKTITITVNNPPKIKSVPLKYGDGLNDVVSTNDRIDGSKDWHFFRDRGQFGSYSMFDPMDDESTS